jgi:hypothetical protein
MGVVAQPRGDALNAHAAGCGHADVAADTDVSLLEERRGVPREQFYVSGVHGRRRESCTRQCVRLCRRLSK